MGWCLEVAREEISTVYLKGTWETLSVCSCFAVQASKQQTEKTENADYKPFTCLFCKDLQSYGICCLCLEHTYRIIFRGLQKLVIATAKTRTEINLFWEQVKSDLHPMISLLETEKKKTFEKKQPKIQKRPVNSKWNIKMWNYMNESSTELTTTPISVSKQVQDFIMIKVAALIKDDKEFHKNVSLLNEDYFRRVFKNEYNPKERAEISM